MEALGTTFGQFLQTVSQTRLTLIALQMSAELHVEHGGSGIVKSLTLYHVMIFAQYKHFGLI